MIRRCNIWVLGVVVVLLATTTTGWMATRATQRGEADSLLAALVAPRPRAAPGGAEPGTAARASDAAGTSARRSPPAIASAAAPRDGDAVAKGTRP